VLAVVGDRATAEVYQRTRIELGLDLPLYQQFYLYVDKVLHGDFGRSVLTSNPVLADIIHFFPATLELATLATLFGVALGVPLGVAAAANQGRWQDQVIRVVGLLGYSVPVFWLGLVGLLVFYAKLGWVAGPGRLDVGYDDIIDPVTGLILVDSLIAGEWDVFVNALRHIVLPAALLGYFSLAYISRMTRSFMLEQLRQEYIITARVKGLDEGHVLWHHAFGNVMLPLVTVIACPMPACSKDRCSPRPSSPGRHRLLPHQLAAQCRHERGARQHRDRRRRLHRPQPCFRHALSRARSEGAMRGAAR